MPDPSELLARLSESATLAMARKSRDLKARGVDVVSLSLGEPDFDTPDFIKNAAVEAINNNFTHYPPVNGYEDVRQAISQKFKRDNNLTYTPEQIVISTGAKQSIVNLILSICNPGDEVILPAPFWVSYIEMVKLADAVPVVIPTTIDSDFKISPSQLEKHITDKTRMMIYSSPCNPSGSVYTLQELEELAKVLRKHPNVVVVSDEIYEHICFDGKHESIATLPGMYEQTATVNGVSKAFAMTGWRIGFIGAPLWIAQACTKLQGQFTSGANTIAQKATKAAMEASPEVTRDMRNAFLSRRDLVIGLLKEIPDMEVNTPKGAFYLFPDISKYLGRSFNGTKIEDADALAEYLLEVGHVALVSGAAFGDPNCLRISYAANETTLRDAINRISKALAKL